MKEYNRRIAKDMKTNNNSGSSEKCVARLSLYRRLLNNLQIAGTQHIYSHELAKMAGGSAAQVRRDLMTVGYAGSPTRGYEISSLINSIGNVLDAPVGQQAALVGIGNLGRAIMAFFSGRRPRLSIAAAFDSDTRKTGRVIHGCRCYSIADIEKVVKELNISLAIVTVPAEVAQGVVDLLIKAGVSGILNFAPTPLRVPSSVYVEDIDMTTSLEKVAFFARRRSESAKNDSENPQE